MLCITLFRSAMFSAFQIYKLHFQNQNILGAFNVTSLLWSTNYEDYCKSTKAEVDQNLPRLT